MCYLDSTNFQALYADKSGWDALAAEGAYDNTKILRRAWTYTEGLLVLGDGRQLYVNPDGYAGLAQEGDYTNTDPDRRTWALSDEVFTLGGGRQLYA